jgi:NAD(P)-dependent dehydrogenase (short-subunit alcohol dehydrogenase family)
MREVNGKVAFVTGGVSGIGLGIAKAFCAAGMKVAVTYRRQEHLDAALEELSGQRDAVVHPIRLDVTDRGAVRAAAEETERVFGEIHVLCNNAGVNLLGPMEEATYDDWDWILGVNLGGVINVLKEFLPKLLSHGKGGHVLNVASMASFIAGPSYGVYAASKFAVRGLTESLRYSLARHGIGVSLLCPGLTQSRIYEAPLHRPSSLSDTGGWASEEFLRRLATAQAVGMDANEVGRKALAGMLRNDLYILSHPEFREEVRQLTDEVLRSFSDEEPDAERLTYEQKRRQARDEAKRLADAL